MYLWSTYKYCHNGQSNKLTKYCDDYEYGYNGFHDDLTILLPEDDAATVNWGGNWRMPTNAAWNELINNTTFSVTTLYGVKGGLFTAQNGNYLFLPAGGYMNNNHIVDNSAYGDYFGDYACINLASDRPYSAHDVNFLKYYSLSSPSLSEGLVTRALGNLVRAVYSVSNN